MSVTVSRVPGAPASIDPVGNFRIVFKINAENDLAAEQSQDLLTKVGTFLSRFEQETGLVNHDTFNGYAYVLSTKKTISEEAPTCVTDIETIEVRAGYAQKFQNEFNAEFSAPEV